MTETTNEQLNLPVFSDKQKARFSALCERVRNGELTANQSYKFAQADGVDEDDKGFKGSLKEWVENAKLHQWLDPILQVSTNPKPVQPIVEEEKKTNYVLPIVFGVGVAIVLIYAIKKFSKKD